MIIALRRAAAFWFFVLGIVIIIGVLLLKRGMVTDQWAAVLHVLDLPLLLSGMLYGGTSLYGSMVPKDKSSLVLGVLIALPLLLLFCFFAYLNFSLPFAEL